MRSHWQGPPYALTTRRPVSPSSVKGSRREPKARYSMGEPRVESESLPWGSRLPLILS